MNEINSITNPPPAPPHIEILTEATRSIVDHNIDYGVPAKNYERASTLASMILNKPITPHEIMMIKLAVKLSRIAETPDLRKSYVELIACAALAGEFINAGPITTKRMASMIKPEQSFTRDHTFTAKPPDPLSVPRGRALVEVEDR
jgi:hypothetical protein